MVDWVFVKHYAKGSHIEANTLPRWKPAEVLKKGGGATIRGKPLKDQLEAVNHAKAIDFIKELAIKRKSHQFITQQDIKDIHQIILAGIDDRWAGKYRQTAVFIKGADVEFTDYHKVTYFMAEFIRRLEVSQQEHPATVAADVHFKLVTVHPFIDGNGRAT